MKSKLISALILSVLLTAGCQDKESQAQIDELNRTVSQLTEQNKRLEMDLSVQQMRADNVIPTIFAEEEAVFQKSETINYPKSKEYAPEEGKIEYSVSTLKTNADWLNALLWAELTRENGKVPTREEFVAAYQKQLDDTKKEMLVSVTRISAGSILSARGKNWRRLPLAITVLVAALMAWVENGISR